MEERKKKNNSKIKFDNLFDFNILSSYVDHNRFGNFFFVYFLKSANFVIVCVWI